MEVAILVVLKNSKRRGMKAQEIASVLRIPHGEVTKLLFALEKDGFVRKNTIRHYDKNEKYDLWYLNK